MIERVITAGANADRPDVVRSARLIGDVASPENAQPGAKTFLQELADPARESGQSRIGASNLALSVGSGPAQNPDAKQQTSSLAGVGELPDAALKSLVGWRPGTEVAVPFRPVAEGPESEAARELQAALSERASDPGMQGSDSLAPAGYPVLQPHMETASLGVQVLNPDYLQGREYSPAERTVLSGAPAAGGAADLPLEQVEQWLAELQRLQAQHGQAPHDAVDADSAAHAGELALAGLLRTAEQSTREAPQSAQSARSLRFAGEDALAAKAAAFTASPVSSELPLQGTKVQLESLLQTVLPDEPAIQAATNRATDSSAAALTNGLTQQSAVSAAVPAEVRLQGAESRWGEQMLQALRDQVQTQISQRSQHATIRLDPPELGSLDIQVTHEHGKLNIQINAGQADTARLLAMLSERLRHELLSQNFTEVNVQVGSQSEQGRDGRQRHAPGADSESVAIASESESGRAKKRDASGDILISV
ncbi:flagellar hook-length control protein FliK [Pseudomonas profundi]|uniref:flagellar hook-length control protein FliK n=1 Tax=Pseudomonas profundi TaxID=1981513 RepID=UPI0016815C22|nr:flagellar hook-length control protein FliK [Pseudomonas profundi]